MTDTSFRWGLIPTRFSTFAAAVDEQGRVVRFWLHADRKPRGTEDNAAIAEVRRQVEAYSAGELKDFDLVTHTDRGSDFERGVWQAMTEIPFGETVSYGYIVQRQSDSADRAVPSGDRSRWRAGRVLRRLAVEAGVAGFRVRRGGTAPRSVRAALSVRASGLRFAEHLSMTRIVES